MAKTNVKTTAPEEKKKSKTWLIVLLAVLLTAGVAAGAYYFLLADKGPDEAQVVEETPPPPPPAPVFVELKPFTVNLGDNSGRMLYVGISLRAGTDNDKLQLVEHMPEARNRILMVLTSKKTDELTTLDGKKALADDIRTAFSQPFEGAKTPVTVSDVLFTDFIIQ